MKTCVPPAHRLNFRASGWEVANFSSAGGEVSLQLVHRRCRSENDAPVEHNLFVSVGDKFLRAKMARG